MKHCSAACCHDQTTIRGVRKGFDRALDLPGIAHVDRAHFYADRCCRGLDGAELADTGGAGRIPKHRHPPHVRRELLEQLQPFAAQAVFKYDETSGVATWPCQAVDEAGAD